jgi:hypothetical protein
MTALRRLGQKMFMAKSRPGVPDPKRDREQVGLAHRAG